MTTHNTRDELVELNVHRHLRTVQTSAPTAPWPMHLTTAKPERIAQFAKHRDAMLEHEDDLALQEGAARFRQQQIDYDRHTSPAWPRDMGDKPWVPYRSEVMSGWRRFWRMASAILAGTLFAFVVLLLTAWLSRAYAATPAELRAFDAAFIADVSGIRLAQATPPTILVRACSTQPTGTGFSACTNSTWQVPQQNLIIDVQRAGNAQDQWIAPSQLLSTDKVFACESGAVLIGGPFGKGCVDSSGNPAFLPGQTNNWLISTAITFPSPPPPPPPPPVATNNGQWTLHWPAVTQDNQIPPGTLTAAVSYQVFIRGNNCPPNQVATSAVTCDIDVFAPPPKADVSGTSVVLTGLAPGPYCAVAAAYFTGTDPTSSEGVQSPEFCQTVVAPVLRPAQVQGLTGTSP